jgi:hypothetical protein
VSAARVLGLPKSTIGSYGERSFGKHTTAAVCQPAPCVLLGSKGVLTISCPNSPLILAAGSDMDGHTLTGKELTGLQEVAAGSQPPSLLELESDLGASSSKVVKGQLTALMLVRSGGQQLQALQPSLPSEPRISLAS